MDTNDVKKYETRLKLKLAMVLLLEMLFAVVLIAAVAVIFYSIWWYKFESDILYLLGWYAIFGSYLNLIIITWVNWLIKLTRKYGLKEIKRKVKKYKSFYQ